MRAAFADRRTRNRSLNGGLDPLAPEARHLRLCQGTAAPAPGRFSSHGLLAWSRNHTPALRWLASLALMLGPALTVHLLLEQRMAKAPAASEATALKQLEVQRRQLAAWLEAADQGDDPIRLQDELHTIQRRISGLAVKQCGLPVQQELASLASRLGQDLGAAPLAPGARWQRRYQGQVAAAATNIALCRWAG